MLVVTLVGQARFASAIVSGDAIVFDEIAYGDGDGSSWEYGPDDEALYNEVWRGPVNVVERVTDQANKFRVEGVIPVDVGGFTVREVAFYSEGDLIAIGNYPSTYKPDPATENDSTELYVRGIIQIASTVPVAVTVDPGTVLATREYVDIRATGSVLAMAAAFN